MAVIPWEIIKKYADPANVDAKLIAAIGQHETAWGDLGAGKSGYHLGYGIGQEKYRGLENQVKYAVQKMSKWGMTPGDVSLAKLQAGNLGQYPSGMYGYGMDGSLTEWPLGVWRWYQDIKEENPVNYVPQIPGGEIKPYTPSFWERVETWADSIRNPKPGSSLAKPVPGLSSPEQQESYNQARRGLIERGYIEPENDWETKAMRIGLYLILIIVAVYSFSKVFEVGLPIPGKAAALLK